jgi:hypothetical protein
MMEAGVLLDLNGAPIYWHVPPERSGGSLPDSRNLWDVIWENRKNIWGFAHSHPGRGTPGPSYTDITTFAAIEAALGCRLAWPIVSEDDWVIVRWLDERYSVGRRVDDASTPEWIAQLRALSGYTTKPMDELAAEAQKLGLY